MTNTNGKQEPAIVPFIRALYPKASEEELRQAQRAIDENQNKYKHYLLRDFPKKFRPLLNTDRCGIGERVVFDSYPRDLFIRSRDWAVEQKILPRNWSGNAVPD